MALLCSVGRAVASDTATRQSLKFMLFIFDGLMAVKIGRKAYTCKPPANLFFNPEGVMLSA